MTADLLEARGLVKQYRQGGKELTVLSGASCRVAAGQMVSVIGASGAGKSTLLHLLGSLDVPDAGSVLFRGQDLGSLSSPELATFRNLHVGFVFQFHHLLGEFTAVENVMMPALLRRMPFKRARSLAERALADVGLDRRLAHHPAELSGGEQQRVALARALVLEPELLLADEVTGNLDEVTAESIHQLLFDINRQRGVTQVVVTHNRQLADRMPVRWQLAGGQVGERP